MPQETEVSTATELGRSSPNAVQALDIQGLGKAFGKGSEQKLVVSGIDLSVATGELLCIVGPSGAGKTTLLRCMSGLLEPTTGSVHVNGQDVVGPPESLAVVFQDYSRSLFPWMKVRANVEFPLLEKKMSKADRASLVDQMLASVGLAEHGHKYPRELSGGMQQRVAIARALAYRPTLLLMDEPFASLDAQTRAELEDMVLALRAEFGVTIVFVTHDIDEAVYLGDKVAVLTASPATIDALIEVHLPAKRDQVTTKALTEFARLRTDVLTRIRSCQAVTNGA